jgi:lysozyme
MMSAVVHGCDFSDFQPNTDFATAKASGYCTFGYAKATQGTGDVQETFASNMTAMRAAGVIPGAYHFFDFTQDALAQARFFLSVYTQQRGDLPPMLDLEYDVDDNGEPLCNADGTLPGCTPSQAVAAVAKFLGVVEAAIGRRCVLYCNRYFWIEAMGNSDGFSGHPLWIAAYGGGASPEIPSPWTTYTFWQYSGSGRVPGFTDNVDQDYFNGTLAELQALRLA